MIEQQLIEWAITIMQSEADLGWKLHVISQEFSRVGNAQDALPNK